MRLTIRTLLGYMDDILDPQDAEVIGKRIEESEVATTLYHRVRDVTRRLSLKAPDLDDEKHGVDPNTVAEYLDNVLPDDRVKDFEKICFESDIHLAEVAACHQILAVALGEAAEIDQASREHMYLLPQVAADLEKLDRPPSDPLGVDLDAAGRSIRGTKIPQRPTPVVPDYLRDGPRRIPTVPIVMGTIIAACLVVILLVITGVIKFNNRSEEIAQDNQNTSQKQQTQDPETNDPSNTQEEQNGPEGTSTDNPSGDPSVPPEKDTKGTPEGTTPAVNPVTPTNPVTPGTETNPPSGSNVKIPSNPSGVGNPDPSAPAEGDLGPHPVPSNPTEGNSTTPDHPDGPNTPTTDTATPTPPEAPSLIGRFVSENQALVRFNNGDKSWQIVPQQAVLSDATVLVALPMFRPIIATPNGLSIQLLSQTRVAMQPVKASETPILQLQSGRIILRSLGKQNVQLLLTVGDKQGVITLVNPESAAAISLTYHREPSSDPVETPSKAEIQFFTISGKVLWEEKNKTEPLKLDASEYISFTTPEKTKPEIEVLANSPDWIQPEPTNKLDQNAIDATLKAFNSDKTASLALRELLEDHKREVARFALKCLTNLDQFEPAVASLDKESGRLTWDKTIEQLLEIASQSPEKAKEIKEVFDLEYGDAAPAIWRMLRGYTPDQLKNDGAIQLVEYLEHDRLVFRVMSFYNLRKITGKTFLYEPDATPFKRRTPTNRWRNLQKKGEIIPKDKEKKP